MMTYLPGLCWSAALRCLHQGRESLTERGAQLTLLAAPELFISSQLRHLQITACLPISCGLCQLHIARLPLHFVFSNCSIISYTNLNHTKLHCQSMFPFQINTNLSFSGDLITSYIEYFAQVDKLVFIIYFVFRNF